MKGNLLEAAAEALINTVNTEGVMGKGIALQFKQAFPEMFKDYQFACKRKEVELGKVYIYDLGGLVGGPRWVVNFPTKGHWRSKSKIDSIKNGLDDLVDSIIKLGIRSIAVPPLGCGLGGLDWRDVEPVIRAAFARVPDVEVLLYPPSGAPAAKEMPNKTERPNMTEGRAALLALMDRYLKGMLDPVVSLLEMHKLMYFLQESGQPLRLQYEAKQYGPYAKNLRQVLIKLDGHFIHGYGDGQDAPEKPIELIDSAVEEAKSFIKDDARLRSNIERVALLIDGFEDPYGLELLSTVHWVMCNDADASVDPDVAIEAVHNWSSRKKAMMKPAHLKKAWRHLKELSWDTESRSSAH
ncbi:type II toxin-antitoxin system antitoxin DNA ADP-ribosyl glycohydrolase DarG [Pseudomonas simiae]|uniref:type II toxin-antitoxin system antitoxin DNA ADP-ribosyl glycohydrolase DarG n=1 Tax=Pseudomonas simiae TaxID=321846 RepID=UPI00223C45E1|nr:macro domain-containing protein [Pseudomonas simiae]